jgi:hypothetical protein
VSRRGPRGRTIGQESGRGRRGFASFAFGRGSYALDTVALFGVGSRFRTPRVRTICSTS